MFPKNEKNDQDGDRKRDSRKEKKKAKEQEIRSIDSEEELYRFLNRPENSDYVEPFLQWEEKNIMRLKGDGFDKEKLEQIKDHLLKINSEEKDE